MKLRLKIISPSGDVASFEHPGPAVLIGRNSDCDLQMQGEAAKNVSRDHARIELTTGGAVLTDLSSSNGTLLNDEPVSSPRRVRVGDCIRLGYTGARIAVVQLELSPSPTTISIPFLLTIGRLRLPAMSPAIYMVVCLAIVSTIVLAWASTPPAPVPLGDSTQKASGPHIPPEPVPAPPVGKNDPGKGDVGGNNGSSLRVIDPEDLGIRPKNRQTSLEESQDPAVIEPATP
jgi:hypothetical protein